MKPLKVPAFLSVLAMSFATPAPSSAAAFVTIAQAVERVVEHDSFHAGVDYFTLVGVASLGSCGVFQGRVLFSIPRDEQGRRQLSLLTTALVSGRNVVVTVDDTKKGTYTTTTTGGGTTTVTTPFCRAIAVDLRR